MDNHVEAHEVIDLGVLEAKKLGEVGGPVEIRVEGADLSCTQKVDFAHENEMNERQQTVMEAVAVDQGSQSGELGNEINAVLVCVLPVVVLSGD